MKIIEMAFVLLVLLIVFIPINIFSGAQKGVHKKIIVSSSAEIIAGELMNGLLTEELSNGKTIADLIRSDDARLEQEVIQYFNKTQNEFFAYEFFIDDDLIAKSEYPVKKETKITFPVLNNRRSIVDATLRFEQ